MIFIQPEYRYLLKSTDQVGEYESVLYSGHELFLKLQHEVAGKSCSVIGSLSSQQSKTLELLLLCHTLKKEGALKVSLMCPYLGYSRQDNNQALKSYGLKWVLDMAVACGVDEIISIDIHNAQFDGSTILPISLVNISSFALWEPYFYQYAQQGYSFVFPDQGAYIRYAYLHTYVWAYFEKKRKADDVEIVDMQGKIHKKVVIVDDILDTGETILQACIALQKIGVEEIVVIITHGIFSTNIWNELFVLGVKYIYCTNSLSGAIFLQHPFIKIVSIRFLFDKYL